MSNFVAREEAARLRQKLEKLLRREKPSDIAELVETNRVIIEDSVREAVPEVVKTLMELGPKFVPRRKITTDVLRRAELGVERLAFGRRWQKEVERNQRVEEEVNNRKVVGDRPVKVLDEDVKLKKIATTTRQGPSMEASEENGLRRLKENIVKLYKRARGNRKTYQDES